MTQDPTINIIEKSTASLAVLDIYSKLLQDNIIFINDEIDSDSVSKYQSEILYLMSVLEKSKDKTIKIYINSPGGSLYDALGLYDIMQLAKNRGFTIRTINVGLAASAAALLLMAGSKGYRESLPNCTVMVHQLSAGMCGTYSDLETDFKEKQRLQEKLNNIIKENSCEELSKVTRDFWMSAEKAKEMNVIDNIV